MIEGTHVESIEDLISQIKMEYSFWETNTYPWFRGERTDTSTPLLPKLYRPGVGRRLHKENRLLQQFRMKAPSFGLMNTPDRNHTDEWLFLAQHVGLPTRLLDWTEGLFIALYFALLESKPTIWMLDPVELNRRSSDEPIEDNVFPLTWFSLDQAPTTKSDIVELANLFIETQNSNRKPSSQKVRINQNLGNINIRAAWELDKFGTDLPIAIHPTNIHSRMNSQKSCFTVHGRIKKSLADLADPRILKRYIIAPKLVRSMRKDLKMMGITHTTAFPELDSLARELSELF